MTPGCAVASRSCASTSTVAARSAAKDKLPLLTTGDNDVEVASTTLLALTATATASVQADIIANLRLRNPLIVRTPFNRKNLKYTVLHRNNNNDLIRVLLNMQAIYEQTLYEDDSDDEEEEGEDETMAKLKEAAGMTSRAKTRQVSTATSWHLDMDDPAKTQATLRKRKYKAFQSTLVYVSTKKEAEALALMLQECTRMKDVAIAYYHAGMSAEDRYGVHKAFIADKTHIVIATVAFGMGIHKSDIRLVVHFSLPQSIEAYYQQTGRAGRDGARSQCVTLFHRNDISKCYQIGSSG